MFKKRENKIAKENARKSKKTKSKDRFKIYEIFTNRVNQLEEKYNLRFQIACNIAERELMLGKELPDEEIMKMIDEIT